MFNLSQKITILIMKFENVKINSYELLGILENPDHTVFFSENQDFEK